MKTTLLKTDSSSLIFKIMSILFIMILHVSNLSSQTSVKNPGNNGILIQAVHYQQKAKSSNMSAAPKVYTIMIAKNFPTIESGEKQVLYRMDDSEDFNYDEIFSGKGSMGVNTLIENTSLALNCKFLKTN